MNDVVTFEERRSQEILQTVTQRKMCGIMSYLSKDKWHVAKVVMTGLESNRLYMEGCHSGNRLLPINIRLGQPVGVSFKHAYGKFVFDTMVVGLEPSSDPAGGGTIVLNAPHRIGVIQRRSYFRVNVPEFLKVNVFFWHCSGRPNQQDQTHDYYQGRLIDISAGGAQIVVPIPDHAGQPSSEAAKYDFKKGQFISLRFTPMPDDTPLMLNAQIRNILPTADHTSLCLGLQIVGLEASAEGRDTLARITAVVERYHQMSQSCARPQDVSACSSGGRVASTAEKDLGNQSRPD